jgi:hypothetical protein
VALTFGISGSIPVDCMMHGFAGAVVAGAAVVVAADFATMKANAMANLACNHVELACIP